MKPTPKDKLIYSMLQTLIALGRDPMARIDARLWFEHYLKKAKKLGIIPKRKIRRA